MLLVASIYFMDYGTKKPLGKRLFLCARALLEAREFAFDAFNVGLVAVNGGFKFSGTTTVLLVVALESCLTYSGEFTLVLPRLWRMFFEDNSSSPCDTPKNKSRCVLMPMCWSSSKALASAINPAWMPSCAPTLRRKEPYGIETMSITLLPAQLTGNQIICWWVSRNAYKKKSTAAAVLWEA